MKDKDLEALWLKLLNAKTHIEAIALLKRAIEHKDVIPDIEKIKVTQGKPIRWDDIKC